ncbi:MAG TPA: VOC family protein [Planctomycetota bacterium]|nr:VOC family protein [Planctomycetota bacterium]
MHVIDHVFVFCGRGAPEQQLLVAKGLRVGVQRQHPGQGTANVCFGFANAYLELLWLDSEAEARLPMVRPLGLQERARWRETNASPFGVCVRPVSPGAVPPFVQWDYRPAYLPPGLTIQMACNSGVLGEPMLFAVDRPFQPFDTGHGMAGAQLAQTTITVPDLAPMSLLREVAVPGLSIQAGPEPLMELSFEHGGGAVLDLRPQLPLVLRH